MGTNTPALSSAPGFSRFITVTQLASQGNVDGSLEHLSRSAFGSVDGVLAAKMWSFLY